MKRIYLINLLVLSFVLSMPLQAQPFLAKVKTRHQSRIHKIEFGKKASLLPDSIERYNLIHNTNQYQQNAYSTEIPVFDANGLLIEEVKYNHTSFPAKVKYVYNYKNGKEFGSEYHEWDAAMSEWEPKSKYEILWDHKGVDSADLSYEYNPIAQDWELVSMYVYPITYDAQNRPESVEYKDYDFQLDDWVYYERIRFYYSGNDTLPTEVYVDEYDNGYYTEVIHATGVKWELGFSGNVDIDLPSLYTGYEWDGANWNPSFYDSTVINNSNDYYRLSHSWDTVSAQFELTASEKFLYNTQGELTYTDYVDWSAGVADTNYVRLDSFYYGSSGELLKHVSLNYSNTLGTPYVYGYYEKYYYSTSGINRLTNKELGFYPNPIQSQGLVTLKGEDYQVIQLHSLDGKTYALSRNEQNQIQMPKLETGVYLLCARNSAGIIYQAKIQVR
ncbi:MAG: T9SS type A sorting domain-containing protein [Bacteroidetes bacterium]|nr:MAG: T9SS type A sorting domain-containing protein [Bacteroidota bacterium]